MFNSKLIHMKKVFLFSLMAILVSCSSKDVYDDYAPGIPKTKSSVAQKNEEIVSSEGDLRRDVQQNLKSGEDFYISGALQWISPQHTSENLANPVVINVPLGVNDVKVEFQFNYHREGGFPICVSINGSSQGRYVNSNGVGGPFILSSISGGFTMKLLPAGTNLWYMGAGFSGNVVDYTVLPYKGY